MALRLHNTLTRTKEDFVPIDASNIRMYVCGPTVYDFAHIGNARPLIVFDVLYRLLRHLYGESHVTYVRNITDVDDKINARAAQEFPGLPLNEAIREVTSKTERQFHEDVAALGCLKPTFEPRATEFIARPDMSEDMIRLIARLIEKGNAYAAEGHVLFHVPSMPDYGRLSNRTLDEMQAGARVEVAPYKQDPMDFVLWKPSTPDEPAWDSPWGRGRPGWHIECSAMAGALLGEIFDIHGGGIDLIFPHHENEIAQSRCAHGTKVMANYWLHNGFLQVEGEKMSKSLGNFVTVRDVVSEPLPAMLGEDLSGEFERIRRRWNGLSARLAMILTHYRQPIDWTWQRFLAASDELYKWYEQLRGISFDVEHPRGRDASLTVTDALLDDLNTPLAVTALRTASRSHDFVDLAEGMRLLGLFDPEFIKRDDILLFDRATFADEQTKQDVAVLIATRAAARAAKNFAEADRIRAELDAMGIALKDSKDPATGELVTTWEVKR